MYTIENSDCRKVTAKEQRVAVDILHNLEILLFRKPDEPIKLEEVSRIIEEYSSKYKLDIDPFTYLLCTSEEYTKNRSEYDKQVMIERYGHYDGLD